MQIANRSLTDTLWKHHVSKHSLFIKQSTQYNVIAMDILFLHNFIHMVHVMHKIVTFAHKIKHTELKILLQLFYCCLILLLLLLLLLLIMVKNLQLDLQTITSNDRRHFQTLYMKIHGTSIIEPWHQPSFVLIQLRCFSCSHSFYLQ